MIHTLAALRQLAAERDEFRLQASSPPVNASQKCMDLINALANLRQTVTVVTLRRPKLDVERVWSKFATASHSLEALDGQELRALCCSEKTSTHPNFIAALARNPEKLNRGIYLYGIVNGYFSEWREMEDPTTIEALLLAALQRFPRNSVARHWRVNGALFSRQAATSVVSTIFTHMKSVDEILKSHHIGLTTKLATSVRAAAARSAASYVLSLATGDMKNDGVHCLRWITEAILSDLTPVDAFSEAVSALILSNLASRSVTFQRALRAYAQRHKRLGDPRVRQSALNWRPIPTEAKQRYMSWLACDSITFFFNVILPNNSENQRRKDFWMRYHGSIKDFQVAVSEGDLGKIRTSERTADLGDHSRLDHPTTSAFLMEFEGYGGQRYIVIEFSETGNAAYIFKSDDFEARKLSLRTSWFKLSEHLKFDKTHRILHSLGWEQGALNRLASEFGIKR